MDLFNTKKVKELSGRVIQLQKAMNTTTLLSSVSSAFPYAMPHYPNWDEKKAGSRYATIDDIYSIIRKLVGASISIPMYPFYEKNSQAAKRLKRFPYDGNIFERKAYQVKALEDLPENDPVYKLLENPSMLQNSLEYYDELYTYLYMLGKTALVKMRPEGGVNAGKPVAMEVLCPSFLVAKVVRAFPKDRVVGYDYVVNGITIMENIPPDDIIIIKYFNPNSITDGLSPMEVLRNRITRTEANMNTTVAQMQNGGTPTIIYQDDSDTDEVGVAGQHKENFYKFKSNPANYGAPYWAGAGKLGAIQLGLSAVNLDAANLANIDFKKFCNVWSVSDRLFNNDATGSEISDKNARRALYTDAALPNAFRVAAAIEESLNKDFKDRKRIINADISAIPELQQDNKDLATWLSTAWWVTPNEKREMMKFDKLSDAMFDKPIVPTGLVPLDSLEGSQDLPLTEDYTKP